MSKIVDHYKREDHITPYAECADGSGHGTSELSGLQISGDRMSVRLYRANFPFKYV